MRETIIFQLIRIIVLGGLSTLFSFLVSGPLLNFLKKHNIFKHIRQDPNAPIFMSIHKKKEGTPTTAGVLIWGTTFLFAVVFLFLSYFADGIWSYFNFISRQETVLILGAMAIAALVGLMDDLLGVYGIGNFGGGLGAKFRVMIYIFLGLLASLWFWYKLEWDVVFVPFKGLVHLGVWFIPFFIFIFVACAFSMNETDGLDGLSAGVSFIALAAYIIIAFLQGRFNLAALLAVVIGSLLAYLWRNMYPAEFFMGDTGIMTLGVLFGILAMYTNTALFLPLLLLIPFIESLSVIIQKAYKKLFKKKLFLSTPIHHHFEALGWPETRVTMRFWMIEAAGVALGLMLYLLNILLAS